MKAININCKRIDFIDMILNGSKTIETRKTNSLKSLVGCRVGLIKTGKGKAKLFGYATIEKAVYVDNRAEWENLRDKHQVPDGSEFDMIDGKWLYYLTDIEACEPVIVTAKGIVIRNI